MAAAAGNAAVRKPFIAPAAGALQICWQTGEGPGGLMDLLLDAPCGSPGCGAVHVRWGADLCTPATLLLLVVVACCLPTNTHAHTPLPHSPQRHPVAALLRSCLMHWQLRRLQQRSNPHRCDVCRRAIQLPEVRCLLQPGQQPHKGGM